MQKITQKRLKPQAGEISYKDHSTNKHVRNRIKQVAGFAVNGFRSGISLLRDQQAWLIPQAYCKTLRQEEGLMKIVDCLLNVTAKPRGVAVIWIDRVHVITSQGCSFCSFAESGEPRGSVGIEANHSVLLLM